MLFIFIHKYYFLFYRRSLILLDNINHHSTTNLSNFEKGDISNNVYLFRANQIDVRTSFFNDWDRSYVYTVHACEGCLIYSICIFIYTYIILLMVLKMVAKDLFLQQIARSKTNLLCWMGRVRGTHSSSCGVEVKTEVKTAAC